MKKFFIVVGIFILLVIGAFFIFDHYLSSDSLTSEQKEKALENLLGRPAQLTDAGQRVWATYKGKYFTIDYPQDAHVAQKNTSAPFLDSFSYSLVADHILVTVAMQKNDGSLGDDSGVAARVSQKDMYNATESGREGCVAFVKDADDGAEQSLFCTTKNGVGSFVISGASKEKVTVYFAQILPTLSW